MENNELTARITRELYTLFQQYYGGAPVAIFCIWRPLGMALELSPNLNVPEVEPFLARVLQMVREKMPEMVDVTKGDS